MLGLSSGREKSITKETLRRSLSRRNLIKLLLRLSAQITIIHKTPLKEISPFKSPWRRMNSWSMHA